jgi:hypothetical protein
MVKTVFLSGPVSVFVLIVKAEKRDLSDILKVKVVLVSREQWLLPQWSVMSGARERGVLFNNPASSQIIQNRW